MWASPTGGVVRSSPAIGVDGTVYVGSNDGYLYAITPPNQTGSIIVLDPGYKWRHQTGGQVQASPAIGADGTVYVGSVHDVAGFGPFGRIDAIKPNNSWWLGDVIGSQMLGQVYSSPAIGADGTVYFGSNDSYLYAFVAPASGEFSVPKWRIALDGQVQSSPAIGADGTIYVGTTWGHVYAGAGGSVVGGTGGVGSGFLLGLGDLVAQKLGVLDMAQLLEARCLAEVQVNDIRQVAVLGVEEAERLGGGQGDIVVDGRQRFDAWPVVRPLDQVARNRVGDGVDHLLEDILGLDQLDDGGLLAGPERCRATSFSFREALSY
jgi:hypothetical protein